MLECALSLLKSSIAVLFIWKIVLPFVVIIFNYYVGKRLFSKRDALKKAGSWAIVTGATDGIGKAFAQELAKDGLNIMLISRNIDKLKSVALELESTYNIKTKVLACNFIETDIYGKLEETIRQLPSIGCLVNNVGVSYPYFDYYAYSEFIDNKFIRDMISCNVNSVASMTRIVLPKLLQQHSSGAAIINIGSYSGVDPLPLLTLYGATKAFVYHFTKALSHEVSGQKVILQCLHPMMIATSMAKVRRPSFFIPAPRDYASAALDMLGCETMSYGILSHALQAYVISFIPRYFLTRHQLQIRAKALSRR